ncbi:MAG TPA: type II secretion system protein GspG, partial [Blastocatellia bacterium]|nr:type II secretion system protein GspG [Blastocatellia bacterium]
GAVLVFFAALRAMKLARRDPEGHGGYRMAAATLAVTIMASAVSAGLALAYLPQYLRNRQARPVSATKVTMYQVAQALEEYKRKFGAYPREELSLQKTLNEALPHDSWNKQIAYQAFTADGIAMAAKDSLPTMINGSVNFELRSAGPDEELGTNDDIIMRDGGIFLSNEQVKKQPVVQGPAKR